MLRIWLLVSVIATIHRRGNADGNPSVFDIKLRTATRRKASLPRSDRQRTTARKPRNRLACRPYPLPPKAIGPCTCMISRKHPPSDPARSFQVDWCCPPPFLFWRNRKNSPVKAAKPKRQ